MNLERATIAGCSFYAWARRPLLDWSPQAPPWASLSLSFSWAACSASFLSPPTAGWSLFFFLFVYGSFTVVELPLAQKSPSLPPSLALWARLKSSECFLLSTGHPLMRSASFEYFHAAGASLWQHLMCWSALCFPKFQNPNQLIFPDAIPGVEIHLSFPCECSRVTCLLRQS